MGFGTCARVANRYMRVACTRACARRVGGEYGLLKLLHCWPEAARRRAPPVGKLGVHDDGDVRVGHIPDTVNPADFLTKFVTKDKLKASITFLANTRNRVAA